MTTVSMVPNSVTVQVPKTVLVITKLSNVGNAGPENYSCDRLPQQTYKTCGLFPAVLGPVICLLQLPNLVTVTSQMR